MPGRADDRPWRGLEPLAAWVERAQAEAPACACGCGARIVVKAQHRAAGFPKFVWGHHSRVGLGHYNGVEVWIQEHAGKHFCACGCGLAIRIRHAHFRGGIPRFRHNHAERPHVRQGGEAHPAYRSDRSAMKPNDAQRPFKKTRHAVDRLFDWRCAWCGARELLDYDHIIPVAYGGAATIDNIQPLCPTCHRWKSGITLTARELRTPRRKTCWDRRPHARHR